MGIYWSVLYIHVTIFCCYKCVQQGIYRKFINKLKTINVVYISIELKYITKDYIAKKKPYCGEKVTLLYQRQKSDIFIIICLFFLSFTQFHIGVWIFLANACLDILAIIIRLWINNIYDVCCSYTIHTNFT